MYLCERPSEWMCARARVCVWVCHICNRRQRARTLSLHIHSHSKRFTSLHRGIFHTARAQPLPGFVAINLSYNRHSLGVFHLIASVVSSLARAGFICSCSSSSSWPTDRPPARSPPLYFLHTFHTHRSLANTTQTPKHTHTLHTYILHFSTR